MPGVTGQQIPGLDRPEVRVGAPKGDDVAGDGVVHVASAPVNYGAFELTVGIDPDVPPADDVLDAIAEAGYEGVDLGPVGYLGTGEELADALGQRGLRLAGGYLEVDVTSLAGIERGVADLRALMDCFDAVSDDVADHLRPRPTVALVVPGLPPEVRATEETWLWANAERALASLTGTSRDRNYEPCLHNELGTLISGEADVARAFEISDILFCLDSGNLFVGGGNPLVALEAWVDRICHVHLKDARREPYLKIVAEGRPLSDIWNDGVFCRLGDGEADVCRLAEMLLRQGYSGWLVVEQDTFPKGELAYAAAAQDQRLNRTFLKELGI